jgi:hypothetical protein
LIIQIPPFSRKWLILPEKYIQVLSISHKMADYFAFSNAALITNIPLTSWCNEMIFTEKIKKKN